MDIDITPLNKRETFELWMDGNHVLVHLNATGENVIVPSNLKTNPTLTLKLSHLFQGRTESNESGINTYLKFTGDYFECIIPWESIFALTNESGEQKVWIDPLQANLLKKITDLVDQGIAKINPQESTATPKATQTERKKPKLQRIK